MNAGSGFLIVRTTALAEDSAVARLVQLVEQAAAQRSETEALVERVAFYYTPSVILFAILVATVPPLTWAGRESWQKWFYTGLGEWQRDLWHRYSAVLSPFASNLAIPRQCSWSSRVPAPSSSPLRLRTSAVLRKQREVASSSRAASS